MIFQEDMFLYSDYAMLKTYNNYEKDTALQIFSGFI